MNDPDIAEARTLIRSDIAAKVNFASAQNAVPIIRTLEVANRGETPIEGATLSLDATPSFCRTKSWTLDRIEAGGTTNVSDRDLSLDLGRLDGLNEAERGEIALILRDRDGAELARHVAPVELLARDQWGGLGEMAQILAAFVAPNDPAVPRLLKEASRLLEASGRSGAIDGYQSKDPARAWMLAGTIWSAATGLGLSYAEPPASFELQGQKVRDPGRILGEGLATCLDTSLLMAAALEAAGLAPVVVFKRGHAFAGVWLRETGLRSVVERDVTEVRKAVAGNELVVFETTLLTSRPVVGFEHAVDAGRRHLSEAEEAEFDRAVDVRRARAAGNRPLASHRAAPAGEAEHLAAGPAPLPSPPDFGLLPGEIVEEEPSTPAGRIERWQRKLLDLSLRNRLLNFSDTKQTVPFVCPDVPGLEDRLAAGEGFRLVSLEDENPLGDRDPELIRRRSGQDVHLEFARQALARREVCVPLTSKDMTGRLTALYRKARSDMAEGGTNTLFLVAGFLRWKKSAEDTRVYRAPLVLLPVKLTRRSAVSDFRLVHHEDEVRFNATLLQFLERDFGLRIPALAGDLPTDASGIDLPQVFEIMRLAVRDTAGFEVAEDVALSTFSFAKYLMWRDLVDRTEDLRKNRLVRHLIDSPEEPFADGGGLPAPRDIDRRVRPAEMLAPLPADSSQLAAVVAAAEGNDFVIIGPPGTGKSQTIANMIAHCLAKGRTVLFVAEKSAALDVVHRRLKAFGLADACLELHSNKSDRARVLGQLGAAWDRASAASEAEWIAVTSDLEVRRDELNAYVEALHAPGSHGRSVFDAIGVVVAGPEAPFELSFAGPGAHDEESFRGLLALAERLGRAWEVIGGARGLDLVGEADWSFGWQAQLLSRADAFTRATDDIRDAAAILEAVFGLPEDDEGLPERLATLDRLAESVARTADGDHRFALDKAFEDFAPAMDRLETALAATRAARDRLTAHYDEAELARMPLEDLDRDWREASAKVWPFSAFAKRRVRKLLQSYAAEGRADPAADLAPLRALRDEIGGIAASSLAPLPGFAGERTDAARLRARLAEARDLRRVVAELGAAASDAAAMAAAVEIVLAPRDGAAPAFAAVDRFAAAKAAFETARAAFAAHAKAEPDDLPLARLAADLAALRAGKDRLADWAKWVAARDEATARGLGPLVEAVRAGAVDDARGAFERAYFAWWLPLALDARPPLKGFVHWDHADCIAAFRKLDETARGLASAQVLRAVAHGLPARDGVPRRSELGTLRHQLGLQRPSLSIRKLVSDMPMTFSRLAPCVLMSPLSVAQYLPAGHAQFDLVIFDEASQITTWDAVGSIARGRQSVIVGDPKQLPPTNFFGRTDAEEGDETLEAHEKDLPSILDEAAAAGLPTHQLNWHYRSRDEALIAFSNHHYYGDRLVTFPSPSTASEALVLHRVEGVYARGGGRTNEVEARAIVALAARRLRAWLKRPEAERPSLGVITFNAQQQELILDLLDAERRKTPALEWFFDDEREEPVIVKNLENIQGDERDVMLFSITFGPDMAGKLTMNFGAINGEGGEKRLNVAVTRARSELHVFASLDADRIDLGRTASVGVAHLKNFLDYAARGADALPAMDHGSMGPAESPFEAAVADALRARGWDVRTQIGVSGFRIDLGVVHPDRAGAYLAGVECDGSTYHSSATARDRDQIREAVLTGLGWNILRVWSTDWFTRRGEALARLDDGLRDLLEASRAHRETGASEASEETAGEIDMPATPKEPAKAKDEAVEHQGLATPQGFRETPGASRPASPPVPTSPDATPWEDDPRGASGVPTAALDPDRYFDDDYSATLGALIEDIVRREGPIRDDHLYRAVAQAHGWQRTGRRIRERAEACLGTNERHAEGDVTFVWGPGSWRPVIPFRARADRGARDISRAEIAGLAATAPALHRSDDPARELAGLMGLGRLTEDTRAHLDACLAYAAKNEAAE